MPHFRNFHGIYEHTITADMKLDDLILDDGSVQNTATAPGGEDELYYPKELTLLGQDADDVLAVGEFEFDGGGFGETPPLDFSYRLDDLEDFGETPPLDLAYTLEV